MCIKNVRYIPRNKDISQNRNLTSSKLLSIVLLVFCFIYRKKAWLVRLKTSHRLDRTNGQGFEVVRLSGKPSTIRICWNFWPNQTFFCSLYESLNATRTRQLHLSSNDTFAWTHSTGSNQRIKGIFSRTDNTEISSAFSRNISGKKLFNNF